MVCEKSERRFKNDCVVSVSWGAKFRLRRQTISDCNFNIFARSDPLTGEIGLGGSEFGGVLSRACVDFPPEITKATIEVRAASFVRQ